MRSFYFKGVIGRIMSIIIGEKCIRYFEFSSLLIHPHENVQYPLARRSEINTECTDFP